MSSILDELDPFEKNLFLVVEGKVYTYPEAYVFSVENNKKVVIPEQKDTWAIQINGNEVRAYKFDGVMWHEKTKVWLSRFALTPNKVNFDKIHFDEYSADRVHRIGDLYLIPDPTFIDDNIILMGEVEGNLLVYYKGWMLF